MSPFPPKVSVVIATFDYGRFIEDAVRSILAQDYPQEAIEVVVVDDDSRDNTREVLAPYLHRIRYHHHENRGFAPSVQEGISLATGDLVALLDADDYWYPHKLSSCVPSFQSDEVVAVLHDLDIQGSDERKAGTFWKGKVNVLREEPSDGLRPYLEGKPINAVTSGSVWRMSVLRRILPFPDGLRGFADNYLARHAIFFGKICGIRKSLGVYRIHEANDYGAGVDATRLEYYIGQHRIMTAAFERRCVEFGIDAPRRRRVQRHALAELELIGQRRESIWKALEYIRRHVPELGIVNSCQLVAEALLPRRYAMAANRVLFRRLGAPV